MKLSGKLYLDIETVKTLITKHLKEQGMLPDTVTVDSIEADTGQYGDEPCSGMDIFISYETKEN